MVASRKDSTNPQNWLFLNPEGPTASGLVFGVLRKTYAGRTNSAVEFAYRKCHVGRRGASVDPMIWAPTCEQHEVLLPGRGDDALADPRLLLEQMDACAIEREKALLVYLTLPLSDVDRLHLGWERARSFVREHLARARDLATLLVLHTPGRVGSANPFHAHALVVPRRLTGLGLSQGVYDEELIHDGGQGIMDALWCDHVAADG